MKGPSTSLPIRSRLAALPRFHWLMAVGSVLVLAVSYAGSKLTSIQVPDALTSTALLVAIAVVLPIPAYWHEKGKLALRDGALTIPWGLLLIVYLPCTVGIAGRSGRAFALQDANFARLDHLFGVRIPGIMTWASQHWFGSFIDRSYPLLFPMLLVAFLLPALTGKVKPARQFVTSNLAAFAIGMPLFALFPVVGPWYGYHFLGNSGQVACQDSLFLLRAPGFYNLQPLGVVGFPSFHVIWAIVCVYTLWCFKPLRIPAVILSGFIILSTMTTGWHYFVDVLGGILVAFIAIWVSRGLSSWYAR